VPHIRPYLADVGVGGPHLPQLANVGFEQVLHLPEGNTSSNPSISLSQQKNLFDHVFA
jgi:hypothetical protein